MKLNTTKALLLKIGLIASLCIGANAQAQTLPCKLAGEEPAVSFYGDDFTVQYLGSCYQPDDTFFGYKVCKVDHTQGTGFSHIVYGKEVCGGAGLGEPTCLTKGSNPDGSPADCEIGLDPTTGVTGIKWNEADTVFDEPGDCKEYYFSYPNLVSSGPVEVVIKAGNCSQDSSCDTKTLTGPSSCVTPTSTPTSVPPTATSTPTSTATSIPPTATYTPTNTATSVPPTATYTPTSTATSIPPTATYTPTNTATSVPPTATNTPTSTPTATPTVIITPKSVTCDIGGPYEVACAGDRVSVDLKGCDLGSDYSYSWTSDCPAAVLSENSSPATAMSFAAFNQNSAPSACSVTLEITEKAKFNLRRVFTESEFSESEFYEDEDYIPQTLSFTAPVSVGVCQFDCAGSLNGSAAIDRCGVCNGNGTSCVNCASTNIQSTQLDVDGNAGAQRGLVLKASKQLASIRPKNSVQKKFAKDMILEAQKLYVDAWTTTYLSIPGSILSCNSAFCVNVSTVSTKENLSSSVNQMKALIEKAYKLVPRKNKSLRKKLSKLVQQSQALIDIQSSLLNSIPDSTSSCQ